MGMSVTVVPSWTRNAPSNPFEFSFTHGLDHFDALRHRTGWSWSWWEIFRNGEMFRFGGALSDALTFCPTTAVLA